MSSRVLKKLQSNNDPLTQLKDEELEEDDDIDNEAIDPVTLKKPLNRFDLLNQQSPSESEVKEDDNETEHHSTAANIPSNISKKKKKKRKKKSTKHSGHHISSEDNELNEKYLSEIDSFIEKTTRSPRNAAPVQTCKNYKSSLAIEYKNLNSQYEMRRTFGKKVVKIENKRGRPRPNFKSTYLISTRESWPPVTKDIISMKPCEPPVLITNDELPSVVCTGSTTIRNQLPMNDSQATWFAFEHSKFYQSVQNMFLSAVESTDSDFLVSLIKRCPYHVDSLIQLSELCKITENFAMATELIERAVLILESSLHPSFSLISGNCRLDYRRQENRAFFIVLFKHAQYLESRACSRTALEISKLVLSINPDDPLAMILAIDYYAMRCKQYAWYVKFYKEWRVLRKFDKLPNMAYSFALAQFYLNEDLEEAGKSLRYALLMFPGVLKPLLDELSVQADSKVLGSTYFNSGVSKSQPPALHQLICLYICRAKVIWNDSNVLSWLEKNVNIVLDSLVDSVVNDYSKERNERYVNPPRAILRHVFLADYKEKVPLSQFILKEKDPIMMYDPLPPVDSVNFYERKSSSSSPTSNSGPVSLFFQSMLPTFNLQMQARSNTDVAVGGAAAENVQNENRIQPNIEGGANVAELGQSLHTIIEAMRDFLTNIRFNDTQGGDAEGNESSEEDSTDYDD